jgi:hypothetical protein
MPNLRHNKQHDARGASFKRIAKDLREIGRSYRRQMKLSLPPEKVTRFEDKADTYAELAEVFDAEAKLIRGMR